VQPDRRALLRFLLGSPLWIPGGSAALLQGLVARLACAEDDRTLIEAADRAIDVFDFESVARAKLSPAHWTFLSMGVQHEVTLRRNRSAFDHVELRPRRLVDTRQLDTSLELMGQTLTSPIVLAPCGSQQAFHPEGELAVARAARSRDRLQILSTATSVRIQEVVEARGAPVWFQLYTPRLLPLTKLQLREAEEVGCPVVVLSVDQVGMGQNRDRLRRFRRRENPACLPCHDSLAEKVLYGVGDALDAVGVDPVDALSDIMTLDWDAVDRIRDATTMKFVIKGILTGEDAALCVEHGVDGVVVSNHGGRAEDSGLASIDALPEVVAAVDGRIPVLVDSGFRRGTDFFKGLALGADAVCIGRPYLWGLSAFGQEGVEGVLDLLDRELRELMVEMGTPGLAAIGRDRVRLRGEGGPGGPECGEP
jgi:isopentenyl diphosphate isomerase/L-lactate dehydrogenase-like FMN-dependent dehydrogenase